MAGGAGLRLRVRLRGVGQSSTVPDCLGKVTRSGLAGLRVSPKSRLSFRHAETAGDAKFLFCVIGGVEQRDGRGCLARGPRRAAERILRFFLQKLEMHPSKVRLLLETELLS